MKFFKILFVALVAMIGFNSCSDDCDHDFIEVDYSKKLAGIWTCLEAENDYAEALVFNADGTVTSTGVFDGGYWEKKGTFKIEGNKMTLSYEDGDYLESRFEMVEGEVFSLVDDYLDVRYNYYFCENDLSDEIVGMWVFNDNNEMRIHSFEKNGNAVFTGWSDALDEFSVLEDSEYKVVGDLIFQGFSNDKDSFPKYIASKLIYSPNGTAYGDIMSFMHRLFDGTETIQSWLRVKQNLNLVNRTYDYISAYVSNAKGTDEDFIIMGHTFNIAKMEANNLDMMFRSILSCIELNENSFKYKLRLNGNEREMNDPISVEGNKVVVDMSATNPACRKVEMYMFQDADDCQLHIYMPTKSFINYFANLLIPTLVSEGKLDTSDAAAVEKVFADMESRIESINVSLIYKARK